MVQEFLMTILLDKKQLLLFKQKIKIKKIEAVELILLSLKLQMNKKGKIM